MAVTFSTSLPLPARKLNIPDPGPPPKEEVLKWWNPVLQFLRKPNPDEKIEKARDQARWAWTNFTRYENLLEEAQLENPELEATRVVMKTEHQAFMDIYEVAVTESSKKIRKIEEKRLTIAAAKLQFRSLNFSKKTVDDISAREGGRACFPQAAETTRRQRPDLDASKTMIRENRRYERMHSLDESSMHMSCDTGTGAELSDDIAMQSLGDI